MGGGAQEVISLLNKRMPGLWACDLDEKGTTVLTVAVEYACDHACLDAPVRGIAAMLKAPTPSDRAARARINSACPGIGLSNPDLHMRVRGSNGNVLHVAAARGHEALVKVLLEAGLKPHVRAFDYLREEQSAAEESSVRRMFRGGRRGSGHTPREY